MQKILLALTIFQFISISSLCKVFYNNNLWVDLKFSDVHHRTEECDRFDWNAQWIGVSPYLKPDLSEEHDTIDFYSESNQWNCFRKTFMVKEKPDSAIMKIAVDSKYWLWINDKIVVYEGGVKRGPNPNDTYYDVVDIAPYIIEGDNIIAILCWYWGKDGYSHKNSGKAGLVAELDLPDRQIVTNESWKAIRHPAYGKTGPPHPNYRMPDDNIHFDARADIGNWTSLSFDDDTWPNAIPFGKPPTSPWNQLIKRPIPIWRVTKLTQYENNDELPKISDGTPIIAYLPRNLTISPYLKIKAPAGLKIDMRTDNYKGGSEYNYRSEYITKDGVQEFESLAYLNGHWMIYDIPPGIEILELRYRETRFNTDFIGRFHCDDPFLNNLWMKCRNTMNVNMRDAIQDPDRERAQWWGDAVIVMGEIFYTCDIRSHSLIRKAIHNLVDWQKPSGVLYSPVPSGSWDKELPGQMLSSIGKHGFWYYYLYSGDKSTIEYAYPAVKRYLDLWELGSEGLVIHRKGGWDWGDWGNNIDRPLIINALLYQALDAAINMAKITGNEADIPGYETMMNSIRNNFNRVFWTGSEYRSPNHKGVTDDRGHGLAVLTGLAKPDQWPLIKKVFTQSFQASPYMEKYILEALLKMGDTEAALTRMKSRYRIMVESEYTTLWEGWGIGKEGYGGGSYNHGWSGGPLTLMMQYIAGMEPITPGFEIYQVKPQIGDLNHIDACFESVKGYIKVNIDRGPDHFSLKLNSPPKTVAHISIPVLKYGLNKIQVEGKIIWEKGEWIGGVENISPSDKVAGHACFTVEPGIWSFEATRM